MDGNLFEVILICKTLKNFKILANLGESGGENSNEERRKKASSVSKH